MSGLAVAAAAAVTTQVDPATVPDGTRMAIYGYGGTQVFEQQGSLTTSGFSGSIQDLTPTTESESNDRQATADKVSLGSTVSATLTSAEVDWYAFDATVDQTVVLELDRDAETGITGLILYDSEGEYLDLRYVGTGQPARIDLDSASRAGTYFVQVVDVQSGSGPYTLTVQDAQNVTPEPTATPTPEQSPYYGTVRDGTNRIEAEMYDERGEGIAYHDTTDVNSGGEFRDEGVDIGRTADDNGYNVGWIDDGEWLEYTITLPAGSYECLSNCRLSVD
jgi:hypothetical protein